MKKVLIYLIIVAIGAYGVYYALGQMDKNKSNTKTNETSDIKNDSKPQDVDEEIIPSKDAFVSEAIKLQTLAENKENNQTCKCYNVKDLDINTSLYGSILVYTSDDLFISSMWLSNGYYKLDGSDTVSTGELIESSDKASLYCGEASMDVQSSLCATNY